MRLQRVTTRPYMWRTPAGESIPGVGLMRGGALVAFLTRDQAFDIANRIVDMAEQMNENEEADHS